MGQDKRMACKNIMLKKNMRIFRIFFLTLVLNFTFNIFVYASSSTNLIFNSSNLSRTLSYMGSDNISLELELVSGNVKNRTIKILDKNKNVIQSFWGNRTFNIKEELYPLTFVLENQTSTNFEVRYKISTSSSSSDNGILDFLSELKGSVEDLLSKLINLLDNLLNIIIDRLNTIIDKLNYLIDYLTNVDYLKNSIDNLKDSIDNLNNKFTPNNSVISSLDNLGSGTESLDTISLSFPGIGTFTVFDLSYFSSIIKIIRDLLSAIMWVEFAVFCIRIVVPKFKV